MNDAPDIFLPRDGAIKISASTSSSGNLTLQYVSAENFYVVKAIETARQVTVPITIPSQYEVLNWDGATFAGQWMTRTSDAVNLMHLDLMRRPTHFIDYDKFRELVTGVNDPGGQTGFLITHDPDLSDELREYGVQEFVGWLVERGGVRPISLDVEPEVVGIQQLEGHWALEEMATHSVLVVGCGSIGGTAADALARFGVGIIHLVDPDRFRWHNMLRHLLGPESVGAHKVSALSRALEARWPSQTFIPHTLDVVEDAHELRRLLAAVDLVICAADGIAPRRVVSHLARRASKPAVLAAVLDDGAIGEVIRLRPTPRFGCLLCIRAELSASNSMDAEAIQERDYGSGHVHLPMTAMPPDLQLIGALAAKVAVATLLESLHGIPSQRLPNELALVGLQPKGDLAPPFDLKYSGDIRWRSIPRPRPDCPTCNP